MREVLEVLWVSQGWSSLVSPPLSRVHARTGAESRQTDRPDPLGAKETLLRLVSSFVSFVR